MNKWIWPLSNNSEKLFPDEPGSFGSVRRHDIHTGVDLYCELGQKVVAVEDGEVISIENFTGPNADSPSPWWNDTQAVLVRGISGVVVYGEIASKVSIGDFISQGDLVGIVETSVLKKYKGRPMVMLHFELMSKNAVVTTWWRPGEIQPTKLLNPTKKLLAAADNFKQFSMKTYDQKSFLNLAT